MGPVLDVSSKGPIWLRRKNRIRYQGRGLWVAEFKNSVKFSIQPRIRPFLKILRKFWSDLDLGSKTNIWPLQMGKINPISKIELNIGVQNAIRLLIWHWFWPQRVFRVLNRWVQEYNQNFHSTYIDAPNSAFPFSKGPIDVAEKTEQGIEIQIFRVAKVNNSIRFLIGLRLVSLIRLFHLQKSNFYFAEKIEQSIERDFSWVATIKPYQILRSDFNLAFKI